MALVKLGEALLICLAIALRVCAVCIRVEVARIDFRRHSSDAPSQSA